MPNRNRTRAAHIPDTRIAYVCPDVRDDITYIINVFAADNIMGDVGEEPRSS